MAQYEWDLAKAASNYTKHGIYFADAVGVFEDDRAITIEDDSANEQRFKTLGMDFLGRLLVVAWTMREEVTIRVISARTATAPQRVAYESRRR